MSIGLSVVIPVYNEEDNVAPLAREIVTALVGTSFEILFVDDGSTDRTRESVLGVRATIPQIRLIGHSRRGGQSAALCSGIAKARAEWIVTMDGDGQNDPADIPRLVEASRESANANVGLFCGHRRNRRDTAMRRLQSRVANAVRSTLLGDATPDTGCGIKLFRRAAFLELPRFDHMHRFLPALFRRAGLRVISVGVNHRPRACGQSKYGLFDRLGVGIVDLFGVMWLMRRHQPGLVAREDPSS